MGQWGGGTGRSFLVYSKYSFIFNGIFEVQNPAGNAKRFTKMRRRKYEDSAFTIAAFTMIGAYAKGTVC
jgi:hypothetical protein